MNAINQCPCCSDQYSMNSSKVDFPVLVHLFAAIAGLVVAGGIQAIFHPSHAASLVLMFFIGFMVTLIISAIVWEVTR